MRRGFLNNNKKAKDKPLSVDLPKAEMSVVAPPKQVQSSGGSTSAVSRPKPSKETIVGTMFTQKCISSPTDLEPYAVARIPSPKFTQSKEPYATCIIRLSTLNTIINTPGFCTPLPPLNLASVVFTKTTPNMGVGLFTKSSVRAGQVIFSERPLLILPKGLPFYNRHNLSTEDAIKAHHLEFEELLQRALGLMTKEAADAYTSLSNCLPDTPQLYGISRTNSYGTGADIEVENLEEGKFEYAAVGKLASRINHSCVPNVRADFHMPTFSLQIIAQRNIKAGGQLFYSYCQPDVPVKERRRQLATYGFVCQCKACVNATSESDKLQEEMDDRIRRIVAEEKEMLANPRFNIRSLDPLLKLEKDIVKEGLDFGTTYVSFLCVILEAYKKLESFSKEWEYYNKVKKYTGKTD